MGLAACRRSVGTCELEIRAGESPGTRRQVQNVEDREQGGAGVCGVTGVPGRGGGGVCRDEAENPTDSQSLMSPGMANKILDTS